jgi:predicted solute-binding protein
MDLLGSCGKPLSVFAGSMITPSHVWREYFSKTDFNLDENGEEHLTTFDARQYQNLLSS